MVVWIPIDMGMTVGEATVGVSRFANPRPTLYRRPVVERGPVHLNAGVTLVRGNGI